MLNEEYTDRYSSEMSFRDFLTKTFLMVAIGLAVTTTVAFIASKYVYYFLYTIGSFGFIALIIAELGIVLYLSTRLLKISKATAYALFFVYAVLNGINISTIFLLYTGASVVMAFGMTTLLFACMSIIGHTTNVDLTKFSSMFFVGLGVLIVGSIINIFIGSSIVNWFICVVGVVIFLGLIAYDMQRLRHLYNQAYTDSSVADNLIIYGALQLYLDFINLFLRVLRLFGKRRN